MSAHNQNVLALSPRALSLPAGLVRNSEWLLAGFLAYTVALTFLLPIDSSVADTIIRVNLLIVVSYSLLVAAGRLEWAGADVTSAAQGARDMATLALFVLAYREMGWFAQPHAGHSLETGWVAWDRAVLAGGLRSIIESLGPIIPSALEISYTLVYALAPFAVVMLYVYKRQSAVDQFLLTFGLGVLLCYAQFPFWPSDPPRVVFMGQDLPSQITVFRKFNLWMLGNYGIHTSVFPSAHVGGAFSSAFGALRALPEHRWVGRTLLVIASLIAVATVYGRYHYLPDALAGGFFAILAGLVADRLGRASRVTE